MSTAIQRWWGHATIGAAMLVACVVSAGGEEPTPEELRARIEAADPSVVPIARRWLGKGSDVEQIPEDDPRLVVALNGVEAYQDQESARLAGLLYRRAGGAVRSAAAAAIAAIGTPAVLSDLKQIVWDQRLDLATRCRAAESLVQLNEDLGRQFLLLQYDLYRLELETFGGGNMGPAREALQRLGDESLRAELQRRIPTATGKLRRNIETLLEDMQINSESIPALVARVADPTRANSYARYTALAALSRKGDHQQLALLQDLQPWQELPADHAQQVALRQAARDAVLTIRRRCWQAE
ncbi:MAG: hypothetical protein KDB14_02830 [Planctomycetales bacterium]|nr:hypothetical protein [Planctomycetales bacterium]